MFSRLFTIGLVLVGFALVGLAVLDYNAVIDIGSFLPSEKVPYLEVAATEFDLDGIAPGKEELITVHLKNLSGRPSSVVGASLC